MSDWELKSDYLRCNPEFHGHPRYDCILINTQDKPYIARLVCIFSCTVDNQAYPLALVQPFSSVFRDQGCRQQKDIDLGLFRFRENKRKDSEFISIHAIIRGVVMVPDSITPCGLPLNQDYFLFDLLDADIFLRSRNNLL